MTSLLSIHHGCSFSSIRRSFRSSNMINTSIVNDSSRSTYRRSFLTTRLFPIFLSSSIPTRFTAGVAPSPSSISDSEGIQYYYPQAKEDIQHAISMVRKHDPVGYLPGRLLPTVDMQWTYYAVRSFWVETGLRFTKAGATTGSARERTPSVSSPEDYLNWWKGGIDTIYDGHDDRRMTSSVMEHPTLRLLYHLSFVLPGSDHRRLSKCHFEDVLKGRFEDLSIKQYTTVQQLVEHAEWSCGSLSQLILESDNIFEGEYIIAHRAAKFVGIAHGLTNALRLSIPIVSTTGKLVIPQDLCSKYGVRSPRYLLSALGQGDMECIQSLQSAVKEIADEARRHLSAARELRHEVLTLNNRSTRTSVGDHVVSVLLPAITSETFLNRLESYHYDLTNRNLRHVNMIEHMRCSMNLVHASMSKRY